MADKLTLKLTDEQQQQIKAATGKEVRELSFDLRGADAIADVDLENIAEAGWDEIQEILGSGVRIAVSNENVPLAISLTDEQRRRLQEATGKDLTELKIESQDEQIREGTCSGWVYGAEGDQSGWVLKPLSGVPRQPPPRIDTHRTRYQLRIGDSAIERLGVFTNEPIAAGSEVIEYTGERVNPFEFYLRSKASERVYSYVLDKFWTIDGASGGSGAEFINHACMPNLRSSRRDGRVFLESLRDIEAGEELTVDYQFLKDAPRVPCYCGSPQCRGTINRV